MTVRYSPVFLKKLKQADVRVRKSFKQKLELFLKNPNSPYLNNHILKAKFYGLRSINITSDWRAIYERKVDLKDKVAYFVDIGTHKELYG